MAERKQISVWISAESAALLQRLADEQSQPKNKIIEWALAAYATGEPTSNDTSDLLDWRTDLSNRLLALETRLDAIEAVGAVGIGAVGNEAVSAACETVDAEPGIDQGAVKKKNLSDDELDAVVSRYLAQEKDVAEHAMTAMKKDGFAFGRNRFFESRNRVKQRTVNYEQNQTK